MAVSKARPVVIGGCGRSGTTLLRVMLDSHPDLFIGPETNLVADKGLILPRLTWLFGVPQWQIRLRHHLMNQARFAEWVLSREAAKAGKSRWGEKTPRNVQNLSWLFQHFPDARFIHVIRDGYDVSASLRLHPKMIRRNGVMVPNKEKPIRACVQRWVKDVTAGLAWRGHPHYTEVRYEELVTDPERVLRRLLDFCDLPWSPMVLRHTEIERDTSKFAPSANAVEAVTTASIGRGANDLTPRERQVVERLGGDLLQTLGYAWRP